MLHRYVGQPQLQRNTAWNYADACCCGDPHGGLQVQDRATWIVQVRPVCMCFRPTGRRGQLTRIWLAAGCGSLHLWLAALPQHACAWLAWRNISNFVAPTQHHQPSLAYAAPGVAAAARLGVFRGRLDAALPTVAWHSCLCSCAGWLAWRSSNSLVAMAQQQ